MGRLRWPRHGRVPPLRLVPQRVRLPLGGGMPILPHLREDCIQEVEASAGGQGSARDSAAADAAAAAAAAAAADADAADAAAAAAAAANLRPAAQQQQANS